MAELIIPKIDTENYKAFCELLGVGMPTTYADWLHDRSDQIAHNKSLGHTSREVAIYPDEVTKFLKGSTPNAAPLKSLDEFLLEGPLKL